MKMDDDKLIQDILSLIGAHADKHKKALTLIRLKLNNDLHPLGFTIEWKHLKSTTKKKS